MMHARRAMVAGSVAAAVIVSMTLPVAAATDDQARLDAAMEAFNERMTAAGWESQGLPDDDDDDGFETDDDLFGGDDAFVECLGELAAILEGGAEFAGEAASAESEEFIFVGETETPETTEPGDDGFSFDLDFEEEQVAAVAFTVAESDLTALEEMIDVLGSEETGECVEEALLAELEDDDMEDIPFPMEFDIGISTEGDLGVGEQSAAMGFVVSFNVFGIALDAEVSIQLARDGRDVVGLMYFVSGEPLSGLDPLAELQLLVDSL